MKHTTVLVIEHEDGQSLEGAIKCRNDVDRFASELGMEVVGAMTKEGDHARGLAAGMLMEDDDA